MFQLDILFYKVKPPVLGIGHIFLSHWTKATHETHPHHQISKATVKVIAYSLQLDGKALLLKTKLVSLNNKSLAGA